MNLLFSILSIIPQQIIFLVELESLDRKSFSEYWSLLFHNFTSKHGIS